MVRDMGLGMMVVAACEVMPCSRQAGVSWDESALSHARRGCPPGCGKGKEPRRLTELTMQDRPGPDPC